MIAAIITLITIVGIVAGLGFVVIGLGWAFPPERDPRDISIGDHIAESYAWHVTTIGAIILTVSVAVAVVRWRASRARRRSTPAPARTELPEARVHARLPGDKNGK